MKKHYQDYPAEERRRSIELESDFSFETVVFHEFSESEKDALRQQFTALSIRDRQAQAQIGEQIKELKAQLKAMKAETEQVVNQILEGGESSTEPVYAFVDESGTQIEVVTVDGQVIQSRAMTPKERREHSSGIQTIIKPLNKEA